MTKKPAKEVPEAARAAADAAVQAAGGGAKLARGVGVTRWAVHQWRLFGIPASRVAAVSRLTGLPIHQLRPDLFDDPAHASPAEAA